MYTHGELNPKIKEFFKNHFGEERSTEDLLESILWNEIYSELIDSRRWWDEYFYVTKLGDTYIGYNYARTTGDNSPDDVGYEFDLSSFCFVEKAQETIIKETYRPIKGEKQC